MIDVKIVILLIGVFLLTIGFINNYKKTIIKKTVYKFVPRDVYDEIFFSLPIEFNQKLYEEINPSYILDGNREFNNLYMSQSEKYNKYTAYDEINNIIFDKKFTKYDEN